MVSSGDFLAALAASSDVSYALTPVILDVRFLGHERQELAGFSRSRGKDDLTLAVRIKSG